MFLQVALLALMASAANAHMQLWSPAPLKAANNPNTAPGTAEQFGNYPYNCCGKKTVFPCRGHLDAVGTPEGKPTASWAAGSTQTFSIAGLAPLGGTHFGGSCQTGFSIDSGKTFQVGTSWQGNCPLRNKPMDAEQQKFVQRVPADLPPGDAIFTWTWNNREQEFFMDCAVVTITPAVGSPSEAVPFNQRPLILASDSGNGCQSPKTSAELMYPNPGPDVVQGDGEYPLQPPTGKCS